MSFVAASAFAEPPETQQARASDGAAPPLHLDEVIAHAVSAHPLVRAAGDDAASAEGELLAAEGAFDATWRTRVGATPLGYYPNVRVDTVVEKPTPFWGATTFAGYRWGGGDFAVYDGKMETQDLGEVRAGIAVPLWRNGVIDRRRVNIERSEAGVELAERGVEGQRNDVGRVAALRYWEWVLAGHRVVLADRLLALAEGRDAGIRARVASGDLAAFEADENQRAILQRRQLVVSAERGVEQTSLALGLYLRDAQGRPRAPDARRIPRPLPPPPQLPAESAGELARALQRRPDLARFAMLKRQAAAEERLANNQLAPAVDVFGVGSQDLGDGDPSREPFELEVGLLIDVPLERNQAEGRGAAARASLRRLEVQRGFAVEQALAELQDARSAVEAAKARAAVAREERIVSEALAVGERDRFDLGESSLLLVNLREQAMIEAQVREVEAVVDSHRAAASWSAAAALWSEPSPSR